MMRIARGVAWTVVCLTLLVGFALADEDKKKSDKKPDKDAKVIVLQLDASKLSPELLKQLLQAAGDGKKSGKEGKKSGKKSDEDEKPRKGDEKKSDRKKQISLTEAIGAAEKHAQGAAVKAQSTDEGFTVEVKTNKGRVTVKLDRSGKVRGEKKGDKDDEDSDKRKGKEKKKKKERD
jgi:hypothetical protein